MNNYDKAFLKVVIVIFSIVLSVGEGITYEYSHVWNETGVISSVGPKTYNDNQGIFVTQFTVTVPVHGTFTFTTTSFQGLCGNVGYNDQPLVKGTVVALIKLNCGGYDLVVDP